MTSMPWFRLYSEVLHDRKIRKICQLCKQPKAVVLGVWVTLLAIASESPERGRLLIGEDLPLDLDDLADETGLPLPELDAIMSSFKQMGMVLETGHIGKWDQRQFQSDNSTLRVRKHRAKLAEKDMKRDETLPKRSSIVIDSDTDSDTESEKPPLRPDGRRRSELDHAKLELETHFSEVSGNPLPPRKTDKQRKAAASRWWQPLTEIASWYNGNLQGAKDLIEECVDYMRSQSLTVSTPQSILEVARSKFGEQKHPGGEYVHPSWRQT